MDLLQDIAEHISQAGGTSVRMYLRVRKKRKGGGTPGTRAKIPQQPMEGDPCWSRCEEEGAAERNFKIFISPFPTFFLIGNKLN